MSLIEIDFERPENPVDMIETVAALNDWTFERSDEDEITISLEGSWCDYHVSFSWMEEVEALHLACAFDLKVTELRKTEVLRLLALVNEQLWMGPLRSLEQGKCHHVPPVPAARRAGRKPTSAQIEAMLTNALENCERFYQAFQFVVWAGHSASEALSTALFETAGEA
jgi:hypothetical protein